MFPGRILRFEDDQVKEINNLSSIDTVKVQMIADNDQIVEKTVIVEEEASDEMFQQKED
jgi:hypothetical protein